MSDTLSPEPHVASAVQAGAPPAILLEDVNIAWAQRRSGDVVALPPTGTSYRTWANLAHLHARSPGRSCTPSVVNKAVRSSENLARLRSRGVERAGVSAAPKGSVLCRTPAAEGRAAIRAARKRTCVSDSYAKAGGIRRERERGLVKDMPVLSEI